MTLAIDLSPDEEARLAATARQEGLDPAAFVHKLVAERLRADTPDENPQDPTLALFAQWEKEDARMTPEEAAAETRLWEQFAQGVNETRTALGMRRL